MRYSVYTRRPVFSLDSPRIKTDRFLRQLGRLWICLAVGAIGHAQASAEPTEAELKEQARLSIYFGAGPDEYARSAEALEENAFAFVGLDRHVLVDSQLPTPRFADPSKAAPAYPDGVELKASFYNSEGKTVTRIDQPGFYGADISIQANGGQLFQIRRLLLRLPDGTVPQQGVSEAEALRQLAAKQLGRPWTIEDPSLYTYHNQWFWDMEMITGEADTLKYLAFYPPNYASRRARGETFPLYLNLHGSGATRFNYERFISDPYLQTFQNFAAKDIIVVAPHSRVQWQAPAIAELLKRLTDEMAIDTDRIILGGHSMGASGSWRILDAMPEPFAAAVLVAGGNVPPLNKAPRYTGLPLWVVFGENDSPDGQTSSQAMVDAINAAGGDARFTLMPQANHMQSRNRFFTQPDLIDWMLEQNKD